MPRIQPGRGLLQALASQLRSKCELRRRGCAGAIKNCCYSSEQDGTLELILAEEQVGWGVGFLVWEGACSLASEVNGAAAAGALSSQLALPVLCGPPVQCHLPSYPYAACPRLAPDTRPRLLLW